MSSKTKPKTPKGTTDYTPEQMVVRTQMFDTIRACYTKHGAGEIDTPVFELKSILVNKYGEDSKLIYDLVDEGGEQCALRYDLTVPFARYIAQHTDCNTPFKRFHIAKVYRRDQPAMTKGRMREFYQCDYDIAGQFEHMVPDAESLRVMYEVLRDLKIGKFVIKINHRKLLDGIFAVCGVPEDSFRAICSAVDKLDKLPWEEVKTEMVTEKKLDPSIADKVGEYVKLKGGRELVAKLRADEKLNADSSASEGLESLTTLFEFLDAYGIVSNISFDLSLARGLDYYTGVIFEAITMPSEEGDEAEDFEGVGSIAGGGRYDNLVGNLSHRKNAMIPCVGFSIGIERIFSILWKRASKATAQQQRSNIDVFIVTLGKDLLVERMKICKTLWDAGISADFLPKKNPKMQQQLEHCEKPGAFIPLVILFGDDEVKRGEIKIKDMSIKEGEEKSGVVVAKDNMVEEIRKRLTTLNTIET